MSSLGKGVTAGKRPRWETSNGQEVSSTVHWALFHFRGPSGLVGASGAFVHCSSPPHILLLSAVLGPRQPHSPFSCGV